MTLGIVSSCDAITNLLFCPPLSPGLGLKGDQSKDKITFKCTCNVYCIVQVL